VRSRPARPVRVPGARCRGSPWGWRCSFRRCSARGWAPRSRRGRARPRRRPRPWPCCSSRCCPWPGKSVAAPEPCPGERGPGACCGCTPGCCCARASSTSRCWPARCCCPPEASSPRSPCAGTGCCPGRRREGPGGPAARLRRGGLCRVGLRPGHRQSLPGAAHRPGEAPASARLAPLASAAGAPARNRAAPLRAPARNRAAAPAPTREPGRARQRRGRRHRLEADGAPPAQPPSEPVPEVTREPRPEAVAQVPVRPGGTVMWPLPAQLHPRVPRFTPPRRRTTSRPPSTSCAGERPLPAHQGAP